MRYLLIILVILGNSSDGFPQGSPDPEKSKLVFADVQRFWMIYDSVYPNISPDVLRKGYIDQLSESLKKTYLPLIIGRNINNLSSSINSNLPYFNHIRTLPTSSPSVISRVRRGYNKLKRLYDAARFPDVYFAIGNFASAGAHMNGTLAISLEMFSRNPTKINDVLTIDYKILPAVVIHEAIHFQQNYKPDPTLLAMSIREGAADFLTQLVCKENTIQKTIKLARKKEGEIWREFQADMDNSNLHNWLYTHDSNRIKDLGYYMGFNITQAFYNSSKNKKSAIKEILNIKDYKKFLEESGYANRFTDN